MSVCVCVYMCVTVCVSLCICATVYVFVCVTMRVCMCLRARPRTFVYVIFIYGTFKPFMQVFTCKEIISLSRWRLFSAV